MIEEVQDDMFLGSKINLMIVWFMGVMLFVSCIGILVHPVDAQTTKQSASLTHHAPIQINSGSDFTPANGVSSGNGSPENPWIIENLFINSSMYVNTDGGVGRFSIFIQYTSDYFIIRNCHISNYSAIYGIYLFNVSNCIIQSNVIENNYYSGISFQHSNNIKIMNNTIKNHRDSGICFLSSSGIVISDNTFISNQDVDIISEWNTNITLNGNNFTSGILIESGDYKDYVSYNIDTSNKINGKPIYYLKNQKQGIVPNDAGQVILANCSGVIIENLQINNGYGIILGYSNNNTIRNNVLSFTSKAISLIHSQSNNIYNNTIQNNICGIFAYKSNNNVIYHNSFINNTHHVESPDINIWDNGYPSGGNYWDNYTGKDSKSGSSQNLPGSDGIGDTPYKISDGNVDSYPLMKPYNPGNLPTPSNEIYIWVAIIIIVVVLSFGIYIWHKKSKLKEEDKKLQRKNDKTSQNDKENTGGSDV